MNVEARDIVAIIIVVGVIAALIFKVMSSDQALAVIMAVLGYYFGYKHGYGEKLNRSQQQQQQQPSGGQASHSS